MKVIKKAKVVLGVIILILIGTLSVAAFTPDQLDDRAQIEDVLITYARSMDHLDKNAWSNCFSASQVTSK